MCVCVCVCAWFVLKLKMYLSRHKEAMKETLIFFKIVPLAFNALIPVSFLQVNAPLKAPLLI